ncbi:tail assembly chaperone [Mycobacterium phage Catdawg]|uniref:Tail assembly chaperone n=1 Tax=Mycobacterium phage Catdawg TaxID=1340819 RepID=S5XWU3_9CAUD|nr:tail assembly chaperone [Mycobacterium phage Catdawg]AGT12024.1 tail assembly chaperone [Mycobacterium phage Catdawg]
MSDNVRNLPHTAPDAGLQAREQATNYDSVFADTPLTLNNGEVIMVPPHPDLGMLSDEAMAEYEQLQFEMESYDREEDIFIPEQRLRSSDGHETGVVLPASTQKGDLKRPYRKDGVLISPPHSVRVARIALGEENYAKLRAGGKSAADVWRIWGSQAAELQKRQVTDSKVMEAHWLWRQYPRQIASDLSQYHHRRIKEWHDGSMSSYELLELLEFMPEEGAFKTAARGGEWSEAQKVQVQIANELAVLRAAYVNGVNGDEYGSKMFYSPLKLREFAEKAEAQAEVRESFYSFAARPGGVRKPNTPDDEFYDDAEDVG